MNDAGQQVGGPGTMNDPARPPLLIWNLPQWRGIVCASLISASVVLFMLSLAVNCFYSGDDRHNGWLGIYTSRGQL